MTPTREVLTDEQIARDTVHDICSCLMDVPREAHGRLESIVLTALQQREAAIIAQAAPAAPTTEAGDDVERAWQEVEHGAPPPAAPAGKQASDWMMPEYHSGTNTDGADPVVVLRVVRHCANLWEPEARLLGNVQAGDIVRAVDTLLAAHSSPAVQPTQEPSAHVEETP